LSGAALALTSAKAPEPEPLFLAVGEAPPAALTIAAVADPGPVVVDEAPDLAEPMPAADEATPDLPTADPAPVKPRAAALTAPPPDVVAKADISLPEPEPIRTPELTPEPEGKTADPEPKPKDTPKPKERPQTAEPKEAKPETKKKRSASAGSTAPTAAAKSSGGKTVSSAAYAKAVMRKVRATKKKFGAGKGTVVVGFSIGREGGLATVSVLQGSGNAALDQIATDHIRRAAPFPAPPDGVDSSFSFEFVGK
jgi:protein TonB